MKTRFKLLVGLLLGVVCILFYSQTNLFSYASDLEIVTTNNTEETSTLLNDEDDYHEDLSPVYQLFNPNANDHLYTLFPNEVIKLTASGWINNGIKWYSPNEHICTAKAVYRLYDSKTDKHLFTSDINEKNTLVTKGWDLELKGKPAFYSLGNVDITRLYNKNTGDHLLTISGGEIAKLLKAGWVIEACDIKCYRTDQ